MNILTTQKTEAEIAKLLAETGKLNTENRWYPLVVGAALFGAGSVFATALVGLLKVFA